MRRTVFSLAGLALLSLAPVSATAATLAPALQPLQFLVGRWESGKGVVSDTGGTSRGGSTFTVEADGAVLLRKDHTDLFDKTGKPAGGFDQIMMIYAEGGALHADYQGGGHLIHYVSATTDGKSVEFSSAAQPGVPVFHLRYEAQGPDALKVNFGIIPPGQAALQPIATGELHRAK